MPCTLRRCVLAASVILAARLAAGQSFTTIEPDTGFDYAVVQDISADGVHILVSLQNSSAGPPLRGYVLNRLTGARTEIAEPTGRDLNPIAINANGSVVVGTIGGGPLGRSDAFVWSAGTLQVIGGIPGGEINYATGVSLDGNVVCGITGTAMGDPYQQGWKWTGEDGFTPLNDIGDDILTFSTVENVSGNGLLFVGTGTIGDFDPDTDDFTYGAVWDNSVTPTNMGNLPNPFSVPASPYAASDDGSVVVGFGGATSPSGGFANHGFRWTAGGGFVDLGVLPASPNGSIYALDCSSDASTIVGYSIVGGVETWNAVIWTQATGWRTLRDILAGQSVAIPANIVQRETFVSGDGRVVGGWAYNTTTQRYKGYYAVLSSGGTCDADANDDGNIDQDDVAYVINVVARGSNPTGFDADFNRDGNSDQDDVAAFINVVAGGNCP